MPPRERLLDLDGFRGLLALWVVGAHVVQMAGLRGTAPGGRLWGMLANGEVAVHAFIILSGFTIALVIRQRRESVAAFLARRFFRLYPVYAVCFLVALVVHLLALPVAPGLREQIGQHILAHALMLHGVLPDNVLPGGSTAFLVPGWSVSLEWQFYLAAPLLVAALAHRRRRWPLIATCAAAHMLVLALPLSWFKPSFLLLVPHLFIIGILSHTLWEQAREGAEGVSDCVALAVAGAAGLLLGSWAVAGWFFALAALLPGTACRLGFAGRQWQRLVRSGAARYFGRISYSLYLCHYLVLEVTAATVSRTLGLKGPELLPWLLAAAGLSVLLAEALYRSVESPGIATGRRVAMWLAARERTAPHASLPVAGQTTTTQP